MEVEIEIEEERESEVEVDRNRESTFFLPQVPVSAVCPTANGE